MRALDPDVAWGLPEQLAAAQVDLLAILAWLTQNQGRKHPTARPPRVIRPGVEPETRRIGTPMDRDAAVAILDRYRPQEASDGD